VRMTGGVVRIWLVYLVGCGGDVKGRTGGKEARCREVCAPHFPTGTRALDTAYQPRSSKRLSVESQIGR
jgi:hypothetical protein